MGGGLPNLLHYYNRGGEGSTGTPNLYYVINGRPLMRNQYTSEPIMIKCFRLYFTQCTWLSLCVPSDTIRGAHLILGCHTGYMLLQPGGGGLAKESLTNKLSQSNHWLLRNDAGIYIYLWCTCELSSTFKAIKLWESYRLHAVEGVEGGRGLVGQDGKAGDDSKSRSASSCCLYSQARWAEQGLCST